MFSKDSKTKRWRFLSSKVAGTALFESLPDAAMFIDLTGCVCVANTAARELFGYDDAEFAQLLTPDLFVGGSGKEVAGTLKKLPAVGWASFESECRRKSAVAFPAELHACRSSIGGQSGILIVVRNIVQHRRAVRSLRDSEELTRAILTSALDAVVSIDERGLVREFNPAAEQLFGYTREEAVGKFMVDLLIPSGARDAHRRGFQRYIREGSSTILGKRIEMQALKRDGTLLPVEIRVGEVRRGQSRIFTAYLSDISERLDALSAIGEERDKLEAILSATSDGIVLVDPSGFVRYANKSFEEIFGINAPSIERIHVRELVARLQQLSPLPIDSFEKLLSLDAPLGGRERCSERCSISLPIERSLQVSRKPVGSEFAEQGSWLIVVHDVSRDEEIRRAKDDLVGNVSHELRTPLTAIRGFVQLLLDKRVGELGDQQRKFLDVIAENVERLMQLVSDLLDVDRVERVPLRAEDVDAAALIQEATGAEAARAEAKGLDLVVDVAEGLHLVGDRERLLQVFQNLIGNAVKYTREGTVRTTVRRDETGMAVLEVSDTGIGMSDEEKEVAFDRFFRSNDDYVRESGGTGLGLSIARTLVERHGGSIEIDSTLGEGTTFRIMLPFDADAVTVAGAVPEQSAAAPAPPTAAAELGYAPSILLVEDSAPIRDVLREGLELEGLRVSAAANGETALAMAAEQVPDAVLLDISLPDMDGWEVLTALRSDPRLAGTAILVLSGLDEPTKALRMGADRFISKPVDVFTLSDEIVRAIEARGARRATGTDAVAAPAEL